MINKLKTLISEKKVVPFVGAGISMGVRYMNGDSAFLSWGELLHKLKDAITDETKKSEIEEQLSQKNIDYLDVADAIKESLTLREFNDILSNTFDVDYNAIDQRGYQTAEAIWGLGSDLIITTNYDKAVEQACRDKNIVSWDIKSPHGQARYGRDGVKNPTVWHLHGHIDNTDNIILTTDKYEKLYTEDISTSEYQTALALLQIIISTKSLLFIGFSLDDEFVKRQIKETIERFGSNTHEHYILLKDGYSIDTLGGTIKTLYYADHGEPLVEMLKELSPLPKLSSEQDKVAELIKQKFPTTKELKSKLFEYLDPDSSEFARIRDEEDYGYLLHKALAQHDCLQCIFQELGEESDFLASLSHSNCSSMKEKAQKRRKVEKLVLRIAKGSSGKIDDCRVEGWAIHDTQSATPFDDLLDNVDFTDFNYIEPLSKHLTEFLKNRNFTSPLDTELILDDGLFHIDCSLLHIDGSSLLKQATIRLLYRDQNFYGDNFKIQCWQTNSQKYRKRRSETIESNIKAIDDSAYIEDSIKDYIEYQEMIVVSKYNLFEMKYLERIRSRGLPLLFSPCGDKPTEVDFDWGDKVLDRLRQKAMQGLKKHYRQVAREENSSKERLVQFVYDDYFEVERFKEMINEKDAMED